jgi:hypothetical protein
LGVSGQLVRQVLPINKEYKMKNKYVRYLENMHKKGYNICDKCNLLLRSEDLIWITSEDFEPKEGEIISEDMYKNYDALCLWCYEEEVQKNDWDK